MSTQPKPLYREPVPLNSQLHRGLRLQRFNDFSILSTTHAVMLNAVEFPLAALSFPVVFVPGDKSDPNIKAVAIFGLVANDNLFVDGQRWLADYIPAFFRRLPFLTAPLAGTDQVSVYIDVQWPGISRTEGDPLFTEEGAHSPTLTAAIEFLQAFDEESQRTAQLGARLEALGLLTPMKADVTLPDGEKLTVDGFMVVDEEKLSKLSEPVVIELHRSGALALVHAHLLSLQQMRRLIDRHAQRRAQAG